MSIPSRRLAEHHSSEWLCGRSNVPNKLLIGSPWFDAPLPAGGGGDEHSELSSCGAPLERVVLRRLAAQLGVALLGRGVSLPAAVACASGSPEAEERSSCCAHRCVWGGCAGQQRFELQLNELLVALLGRWVSLPAPVVRASGIPKMEERSCCCAHRCVWVVVAFRASTQRAVGGSSGTRCFSSCSGGVRVGHSGDGRAQLSHCGTVLGGSSLLAPVACASGSLETEGCDEVRERGRRFRYGPGVPNNPGQSV